MADLAPQARRWVIWTDLQITRRKRYHVVTSPEGEDTFRSRILWECIEWLAACEVEEYVLQPSIKNRDFRVAAVLAKKENEAWQN